MRFQGATSYLNLEFVRKFSVSEVKIQCNYDCWSVLGSEFHLGYIREKLRFMCEGFWLQQILQRFVGSMMIIGGLFRHHFNAMDFPLNRFEN